MDQKGYIKTLEAVIAIVIILLFTFAVTPKQAPSAKLPSAVEVSQRYILSEIQNNDTIRSLVIGSTKTPTGPSPPEVCSSIDKIILSNIPPGFDYTFSICDVTYCISNEPETSCRRIDLIPIDRSIYTRDILVASNSTMQNPKIVRLWFWRK